jgi:hypothetical protein
MMTSTSRWFYILLFGLLMPAIVSRAQIEDSQQVTEEKIACIHNLKTIYEAIQKYQTDHKDLPNWLSDLVPQYLDDVTVLTCPVCKRTGQVESSALADPKIPTSYDYDFCPMALGKADAPGDPTKTWRDWKRQQMALVGSIVPLVRCRHHDTILNLAYDGRVFESRGPWETLVTNQVDPDDLASSRIFSNSSKPKASPKPKPEVVQMVKRPPLVIPPREPETKANLLDLTANYNAMLTEAWLGRPDNDLATMPIGVHTFGGHKQQRQKFSHFSQRHRGESKVFAAAFSSCHEFRHRRCRRHSNRFVYRALRVKRHERGNPHRLWP